SAPLPPIQGQVSQPYAPPATPYNSAVQPEAPKKKSKAPVIIIIVVVAVVVIAGIIFGGIMISRAIGSASNNTTSNASTGTSGSNSSNTSTSDNNSSDSGTNATDADYLGTYTLSRVDIDDTVLQGSDLSSALVLSDYFIEITDSKNISFTLGDYTDGAITTTYTKSGNDFMVKDGSDTLDFTLSGNTLVYTFTENGSTMSMYFTKE
ncbi:MAG: hypothetical protein FWF30_02400, partial [Coriobacteriia bacterium]|nr:hypothetical protein [Coriobacteriia bacterium]